MQFGQVENPSQRTLYIGSVVLLHICVIYALLNSLNRTIAPHAHAPSPVEIFKDTPKAEPPPPLLQHDPVLKPQHLTYEPEMPKIIVEPRHVDIGPTIGSKDTGTTEVLNTVHRQVQVAPVLRASNCSDPVYPAASIRSGESGSVVLSLQIGIDGRVTDSRIVTSSGFSRLDQAALQALTRCSFKPGTTDGVKTPAWAPIKYTFRPLN